MWGSCKGEILPGTEECNGKDDDCDGEIDEDAQGKPLSRPCYSAATGCTKRDDGTYTCTPPCKAGVSLCEEGAFAKCQQEVIPAPEDCNRVDDDCDGKVDQDAKGDTLQQQCYPQGTSGCTAEADGSYTCKGSCKTGFWSCVAGAWGPCSAVTPVAETCNSEDDDCDGQIDEEVPGCDCEPGKVRVCPQPGECGNGSQTCNSNHQWSACSVQPSAEFCNNKDDDCDGQVDEGITSTTPCTGAAGAGVEICKAGKTVCSADYFETCDGKDNNNNGKIDEGAPNCVTTLAGVRVTPCPNGACPGGFQDGPANTARFHGPRGAAVDSAGNIYVADTENHRIRKIAMVTNGTCGNQNNYTGYCVSTFAGNGVAGMQDGPANTARFNRPYGLTMDATGSFYVADGNNQRIRKIAMVSNVTCGTQSNYTGYCVSTFAGNGTDGVQDGPAKQAQFINLSRLAFDAAGTLYVADTNGQRIRKIAMVSNGTCGTQSNYSGYCVSSFAGSVTGQCNPLCPGGFKDGTPGTAKFSNPRGLAFDAAGNLYVADSGNHRIRKIDQAGNVSTFAGSGVFGFQDGPRISAQFNQLFDLAFDAAGNLYIADFANYRIRKVDTLGKVSTLAGTGVRDFLDGPPSSARFNEVRGIAIDKAGNIYVSDTDNQLIRKITPP